MAVYVWGEESWCADLCKPQEAISLGTRFQNIFTLSSFLPTFCPNLPPTPHTFYPLLYHFCCPTVSYVRPNLPLCLYRFHPSTCHFSVTIFHPDPTLQSAIVSPWVLVSIANLRAHALGKFGRDSIENVRRAPLCVCRDLYNSNTQVAQNAYVHAIQQDAYV